MVLRPIEFDAPGNPGPGQPNQGRLDDLLAVDDVVVVRLVMQDMKASANFWKHHGPDEFVFNPDGLPVALDGLLGDAVCKRQRINLAAAALINPRFQKHGIFVWRSGQISWNREILDPRLYGAGNVPGLRRLIHPSAIA